MNTDVENWSLALIFALSLMFLMGAAAFGYRIGKRSTDRGGNSVATLQGAVIGLLALMIGFTFSMALSRFDARRNAVLQEANAIGTTALRARLLPAPHAAESIALLREYTQIRLDLTRRIPKPEEAAAALVHSNDIQERLWEQVTTIAPMNSGMVPTGLYIVSLNEMIDNQAKRLATARDHIPAVVVWSLYGGAIVAIGFTGYVVGLEGRRSQLPVHIVSMLIAAVFLLIQDLDRPSAGFVKVSQQPMLDTAASLIGYQSK